jgi:hypothetical protein
MLGSSTQTFGLRLILSALSSKYLHHGRANSYAQEVDTDSEPYGRSYVCFLDGIIHMFLNEKESCTDLLLHFFDDLWQEGDSCDSWASSYLDVAHATSYEQLDNV